MKHSRVLWFFLVSLVMTLYARTVQIMYLTEESSGFFYSSNMTEALLLCGFIAVFVIAPAAVAAFVSKKPSDMPIPNFWLSASYVLLAGATLYEALFVKHSTENNVISVLSVGFAALSALCLLLQTIRPFFSGVDNFFALSFVFPVLFLLFKLCSTFMVYATVSVIASNVFYLMFLCAALIFFFAVAKQQNAVSQNRPRRILPFAFATCTLGLCCVVPQSIAFLFGKTEFSHDNPQNFVLCTAISVFAIVYSFSLYKKEK